MAVPVTNGHLRNSSDGAFTGQTQGGTVVGAGNIASGDPVSNDLSVKDLHIQNMNTKPKDLTSGTSTQTNAGGAASFAYDNNRGVTRRSSTTINGAASTVLLFGSDYGRDSTHEHKHLRGAMTTTAFADGAWMPLGVSAQRSNWVSGSSSSVTSGVPHPLHDSNLDGTENVTLGTDNIANLTRSDQGYLHYLQSFTTWSDNKVSYSAKNG